MSNNLKQRTLHGTKIQVRKEVETNGVQIAALSDGASMWAPVKSSKWSGANLIRSIKPILYSTNEQVGLTDPTCFLDRPPDPPSFSVGTY